MLLNPFYDFDRQLWHNVILGGSKPQSRGFGATNTSISLVKGEIGEDGDDSDFSSSSASSTSSKGEEQQQKAQERQPLNSKSINKENLDLLIRRIDHHIAIQDASLRNKF